MDAVSQPCGCLTPHSPPLTSEIVPVMNLGTFVTMDMHIWKRLKRYLKSQGATIREEFPNSRNNRRGYETRPGPKPKELVQ